MRSHLVRPGELVTRLAEALKNYEQIQAPTWAGFVKTGSHKERPPQQNNWWHLRCAALLRKIALLGPIGTQKLRIHYGGRKNRGHKPDAFRKGSGSVIRKALQQLEAAELVEQKDIQGHKGRVVTKKGQSLLDKTSNEVLKQ